LEDGELIENESPDHSSVRQTDALEAVQEQFRKKDAEWFAFRKDHPDSTFGQYNVANIVRSVEQGGSHRSLGANIVDQSGNKLEFWSAGKRRAKKLIKDFNVTADRRVLEYGCGSLRVGAHFIELLDSGNFYGLDVVDGFSKIGTELVGRSLMAEKRPQLGVISDAAIEKAAKFSPHLIYSNDVFYHVYPDEIPLYFSAIEKIANRPGAMVTFNASISQSPARYGYQSWAWPMEFVRSCVPSLEFVAATQVKLADKNGYQVGTSWLTYRRA
jgi:hypothetical protein